MWITNSNVADVFVIWARAVNDPEFPDKRPIRGFILEKGMKGLTANKIEGKLSLRAGYTRLGWRTGLEAVPKKLYNGQEPVPHPFLAATSPWTTS